ncbi:hypothetical protein phig1ep11 [Lactobacillus phage phig1e]|uniref:hypothetical protein n=1 Tax=Lactobacillus phage phig1e TaxID=52979 RepID=UPI000009C07B|nr:hypothetical protein phig1ep11 [Lactobacillus phage phig1e]pir/T13225/ hypothetical protein R192 - Lactobacillus phage phi-gle [Lactobacillus phage phi-gle]CAA62093.1 gp192 [Lactobacillus phage phig1e]CAA66754.1 Rorf192 [Lactobacillus phage phig1e]
MEKLLDAYLSSLRLNRRQVSEQTGLNYTTLQRASDKDALMISPRILWGIAMMVDKTPGQVLDELIELEMKDSMTVEEIMLLMKDTFTRLGTNPLISSADMGDGDEAVEVELDLPSGETIRFDIYNYSKEAASRFNVLRGLAAVMQDYDHKEDDGYYPTQTEFSAINVPLVSAEYMAVCKEDAEFLANLGAKL